MVVGVVVPGDSVEARSFGAAAGDDDVGHANDGGGVHASAEVSEDRAVGTEPALDGFREESAEMLFVFGVGAITDFLGRMEWRPTQGVKCAAGKHENQPAMYSSQIAKVFPANRRSGSRMVLQVTWLSSNE